MHTIRYELRLRLSIVSGFLISITTSVGVAISFAGHPAVPVSWSNSLALQDATLGANPTALVELNGSLYFAADDPILGISLWKSDGTAAGTKRIKAMHPGEFDCYSNECFPTFRVRKAITIGDKIFFSMLDSSSEYEVWVSDGTADGTFSIYDSSLAGVAYTSIPDELVGLHEHLYFVARSDEHGVELWKSDGTVAGTEIVKDIHPGINNADPAAFTLVNEFLYFWANDGEHGVELWKSDGTSTGTTLVTDLALGEANSITHCGHYCSVIWRVELDGILYFVADDNVEGSELWRSDGTHSGTIRITNMDLDPNSWIELTVVADRIFWARAFGSGEDLEEMNGNELWVYDPALSALERLHMFVSVNEPYSSTRLYAVNQSLYLAVNVVKDEWEFWHLDGTTLELEKLHEYADDRYTPPSALGNKDSLFYFSARESDAGCELWVTDGTAAGTALVVDICIGTCSSRPSNMLIVDDEIFFAACNDTHGCELWRSDGTLPGTQLLKDIGVLHLLYMPLIQ